MNKRKQIEAREPNIDDFTCWSAFRAAYYDWMNRKMQNEYERINAIYSFYLS